MTEREAAFDRAFAYLQHNRIAGDVVELGVHNGDSLLLLSKRAGARQVWGFDGFAGLPPPGEHDLSFREGMFFGDEAKVQARVGGAVKLVAGWFADSTPLTEPVALVHLDCDLYQSALDGLRLLDPVDGAVVLIDDWYCHRARPDMGVRRGWTEWLHETGRTASWFDRYGWHGSAWVVHRGESG